MKLSSDNIPLSLTASPRFIPLTLIHFDGEFPKWTNGRMKPLEIMKTAGSLTCGPHTPTSLSNGNLYILTIHASSTCHYFSVQYN